MPSPAISDTRMSATPAPLKAHCACLMWPDNGGPPWPPAWCPITGNTLTANRVDAFVAAESDVAAADGLLPWPPAVAELLALGQLLVLPDLTALEHRGGPAAVPALVLSVATTPQHILQTSLTGARRVRASAPWVLNQGE